MLSVGSLKMGLIIYYFLKAGYNERETAVNRVLDGSTYSD
jgi:hypothetical protein